MISPLRRRARGSGVNGVNIGLFCSTPMVALSRNIPTKHAFEMLVTGEFLDASAAREMGLVNRVVPEPDLATETRALADMIASKLGAAVKYGKSAYYRQKEMPLDEAYAFVSDVMVENMLAPADREGDRCLPEEGKACLGPVMALAMGLGRDPGGP